MKKKWVRSLHRVVHLIPVDFIKNRTVRKAAAASAMVLATGPWAGMHSDDKPHTHQERADVIYTINEPRPLSGATNSDEASGYSGLIMSGGILI
jgi:hypothetical protein